MIIIAKEFKSKSDAINELRDIEIRSIIMYRNVKGMQISEIFNKLKTCNVYCDILIVNRR